MRASGKPTRYAVRQAASRSVERRACPRSDMDQPLLPLPVRGTALGLGPVPATSCGAPEVERSMFERCPPPYCCEPTSDRIGLLAAAHESVFGREGGEPTYVGDVCPQPNCGVMCSVRG